MKIHYWADFTCPFSYIGSQNLMHALEDLNIDADVWMHAYELNPDMPKGKWESSVQQLREIDGLNPEEIKEKIEFIDNYGRQSGLPLDFANVHFCNTYDAHRLVHWAQSVDLAKANKLISLLFNDNFAKGEILCDHSVLLNSAREAGLDVKEAEKILNSDAFGKEVRADEKEAAEIPIESIPYFVIDGTVVDHSDTKENYEMILKEILAKEK